MFLKGKANIDVVDNIPLHFSSFHVFLAGGLGCRVRMEDQSPEHLNMAYFYKYFSVSQTEAKK